MRILTFFLCHAIKQHSQHQRQHGLLHGRRRWSQQFRIRKLKWPHSAKIQSPFHNLIIILNSSFVNRTFQPTSSPTEYPTIYPTASVSLAAASIYTLHIWNALLLTVFFCPHVTNYAADRITNCRTHNHANAKSNNTWTNSLPNVEPNDMSYWRSKTMLPVRRSTRMPISGL